jgi:diguanylate cyclase (GGDEF)-like protein
MTATPSYSIRKLVALLLLACGGLVASIHLLNENSVASISRADAEATSNSLAAKLASDLPELESIFAGRRPSAEDLRYLQFIAQTGDVLKIGLYNLDGWNVFNSYENGNDTETLRNLKDSYPDVMAAFANQQKSASGVSIMFSESEIETGAGTNITDQTSPHQLVDAFLPVTKNGKAVGIASVSIDQSKLRERLSGQLAKSNLIVVLLSLLGFALPMIGVYTQTRQKQVADQKVAYLAQFDVLTNLLNRKAFETSLPEVLLEAGRAGQMVAVHFIDLDFFKAINDNYGHAFGDELLKQFSSRLSTNMRPGDMASRFGGDEFVVAQVGHASIEELALATKSLYRSLVQPLQIMGRDLVPSVSMGTSMSPDNGTDTAMLLHSADVALYVVKGQGRNAHRFFEPSYNHARLRRTDLEFLVRKNVTGRNFELHYQPFYALSDNSLQGFEALVRMKDSHGAYVSPAEFVPVAEDLGLIDDIGDWVVKEACVFAKTWPENIMLSVNLSSVQFKKKTACPSVLAALKLSGLNPSQLIVEVTESVLLSEIEEVKAQVKILNSYGVELAMDDFGTGYSSLSYILSLEFDRLKIDRSFVKRLQTSDETALKLVETIISLGHTMKMSVTAEGVESVEQADILRSMGCDLVQGFLYSKPVAATDVAALTMISFASTVPATEPQQEAVFAEESAFHDAIDSDLQRATA